MNINPGIFKAYDIRGIYGKDFDEEFAYHLGRAIARRIDGRNFLVAHDTRIVSPTLAEAVIRGIISMGGHAHYLGMSTTPLYTYALAHFKLSGGIVVTASHNPEGWAGFKVYDSKGAVAADALALYRDDIARDKSAPVNPLHHGVQKSTIMKHLSQYGGEVKLINVNLLLDVYVRKIIALSKLKSKDISSVKVKVEGHAPLIRELDHMRKYLPINIVNEGQDIKFVFDEDADRIYVHDKADLRVRPDYVVGFLVKDRKRFWRKTTVVHDPRFSRGVLDMFKKWKIRSYQSRVGRSFIREAMVRHKADIGGEFAAHIFYKETNCHEVTLLTMLYVLRLLKNNKKSIARLVKPFQTWLNTGEINIPLDGSTSASAIIETMKRVYKDGKQDTTDGLSVQYPDWWFLIRSSNTEPVIRLIVEAKTEAQLKEKVSELEGLIKA